MATLTAQATHDEAHSDDVVAKGAGRLSPVALGALVIVLSVIVMFALTYAMLLALTEVDPLPAFGFAVYCAAWLGLGFGAVFAGAIVFGRDH